MQAFFQSCLYWVCWLVPIKKNKIVFCTFEGNGGYGCSPKYIAAELLKRDAGKERYELVWLVNDRDKEFPPQIHKVRNTLWNRIFQLATARVWVDNSRKPYGTRKRKSQLYIQTWHATICLKPVGLYRGERLPEIARLVSRHDSGLIDYVLSGSEWCTHMYRKGLLYDGEIVETGTPRCDILLGERDGVQEMVRERCGILPEAKVLLYAPTFRGGSQSNQRSVTADMTTVDFSRLKVALTKRFGGEWYILLRLHPQLAVSRAMMIEKEAERLIDVSQWPDMNELIAACDAFLTDYSSAAFEAALIDIPVFIYADDLADYREDRGELMFDIFSLPFSVAGNNEELMANIGAFSLVDYQAKVKDFNCRVGIFEDGQASKRVAELVERHIE